MNYAVILAGGVGSRFWPFSRELEPKQFMKILGETSLLQATIQRVKGLVNPAQTYIITNSIYFYEVKSQVAKFRIPDKNIILEPEGKNTAPAIGLCAKLISQIDKNAVLLVLPSDHYIKNINNFKQTLKKAIVSAKEGFLVTIGFKPTLPSTGYGYIKVNGKKNNHLGVEKFLEKPDLNKARKYFKDPHFYWNSGMFIWKASAFLEESRKYLPKLYANLQLVHSVNDISKIWPKLESISVDYGIMERSRRIVLIPANFYWTDLGSWDALAEIFPKDKKGNISNKDVLHLDSQGVCVFSRGNRLVSTIGIKDIVIADTPDALLVCDRSKTQSVKKLVEMMKVLNRKEHLVHLTEKRPWGSFTVLQEGVGFKIKLIEVSPKKRLSLQRHKSRSEHWVVVSGKAKITTEKHVWVADKNRSVYIPMGMKHRLENPTNLPVRIVEVQVGSYLGEDDIERLDDDFKKECRASV
ncbi:MAG: mannose-1-phosphate guanylyltransferase/mannose-6-phosphate isomerase [Candidatus Omnitrophica bacterium]|nr:mannose-1-phosphate guanylyltransferase/mannose-6-phosphate isomerase [Candidatus Omnitrophota bacterium]